MTAIILTPLESKTSTVAFAEEADFPHKHSATSRGTFNVYCPKNFSPFGSKGSAATLYWRDEVEASQVGGPSVAIVAFVEVIPAGRFPE